MVLMLLRTLGSVFGALLNATTKKLYMTSSVSNVTLTVVLMVVPALSVTLLPDSP